MPLDKIIVLVMAIAFFGGLIFLALKTRRDRDRIGPATPPDSPGDEQERRPSVRDATRRKTKTKN